MSPKPLGVAAHGQITVWCPATSENVALARKMGLKKPTASTSRIALPVISARRPDVHPSMTMRACLTC